MIKHLFEVSFWDGDDGIDGVIIDTHYTPEHGVIYIVGLANSQIVECGVNRLTFEGIEPAHKYFGTLPGRHVFDHDAED